MAEIDNLVEPLEDNESLAECVATALKKANTAKEIKQKIKALEEAQDLLLNRAQSGHLLDNFLDEMLEFMNARDFSVKCFIVSFIEKACKKDFDVMKKAIAILTMQFLEDNENVTVIKQIITVIANLYPYILKWAASNPRDAEANACWEAFSILKGRIMQKLDTENEGIRTMTMKFLESVILSQSLKMEHSESGRGDLMSLNDVPRDHRFISYRKMQEEASHNLKSLLDQALLQHITAQNLMVVTTIISTAARQRPEYISDILTCLETLNGNLPPTLGTSQVKSVRKDMKIQLLRLHRHPAVLANKSFTNRTVTLLTDLGVSVNELQRNLSGVSKKRRPEEPGPSAKRLKPDEKAKDDDEDDEEYTTEKVKTEEQLADSRQTAIDITTQFIYERLNLNLVAHLAIISLMTMPDTMPPAFASSYTPIAAAGSDGQKKHLARMLAIQASAQDLGPGVEQMKKEKLQQLQERQAARQDGQLIPPTPMVNIGASSSKALPKTEFKPPVIPVGPKVKQHFDTVKATKPISKEEAQELFGLAFQRVMDSERRVSQGGAQQMHNVVLVRLVTRYYQEGDKYEKQLIDFIAKDPRQRRDLALLWLAELYAQYQGFSLCFNLKEDDGQTEKQARLDHYDRIMCEMLEYLYSQGLNKDVLYYNIMSDSPLITSNAIEWLRIACIDSYYGSNGMVTLRELILTRNRQRKELLTLLFQLVFYEVDDAADHIKEMRRMCITHIKEFCEVPYLQSDLKAEIINLIDQFSHEHPPEWFIPYKEKGPYEWDDQCIKRAISICQAAISIDPSLLQEYFIAYVKQPSAYVKKLLIGALDLIVKSMSGLPPKNIIEDLFDNCPIGSEAILAKCVSLLSEKEPLSKDLISRFYNHIMNRKADIRSLIPILGGLEKDVLLELLPRYLLQRNQSFSTLHKNLLTGYHTQEAKFTPVELLYEYHRIKTTNEEEMNALAANMKLLLDITSKDLIAAALERLLDMDPPALLFYTTLEIVYKKCPSLDGFLSSIILKLVGRKAWKDDPANKKAIFKALHQLRSAGFAAILTTFSLEDFNEYMEYLGVDAAVAVKKQMSDFFPSLSTHQQNSIDKEVRDIVDDPKERERREKQKERREKERRREREKENEKERDDDRRRERDRHDKKERSRRDTKR